jgi:predicted RNA-binding Zn-ribbon protein involved in translation (DUF1610 family)
MEDETTERDNDYFGCAFCECFSLDDDVDIDESTGFWNCPECGELNGAD